MLITDPLHTFCNANLQFKQKYNGVIPSITTIPAGLFKAIESISRLSSTLKRLSFCLRIFAHTKQSLLRASSWSVSSESMDRGDLTGRSEPAFSLSIAGSFNVFIIMYMRARTFSFSFRFVSFRFVSLRRRIFYLHHTSCWHEHNKVVKYCSRLWIQPLKWDRWEVVCGHDESLATNVTHTSVNLGAYRSERANCMHHNANDLTSISSHSGLKDHTIYRPLKVKMCVSPWFLHTDIVETVNRTNMKTTHDKYLKPFLQLMCRAISIRTELML